MRLGQVINDAIGWFRGGNGSESTSPEKPEPMREAAGVNIDPDEDQWRRLTGDADRDLSPVTQWHMQKMSAWLWESNLMANRLIELMVAYLLAEGVTLSSKDEESQQTLKAFWRDPINNMPLKLPEKVRELALFGEQCWPTFVNETSGKVRLGYLDPQLIGDVIMDPDNPSQPIGIVTKRDGKGRYRKYRIIINGAEDVFTKRTQDIRATFTDGECFYYRVNNMAAGRRGRSDLLAQADWVDSYDQFLFGELDRAKFQRAFFWDVTLKGATPEQVKARAREITAPSPGSVRVHNDTEEWSAETPNLQAGDSAEHARLFRNHSLGGATIPEHWFGGGGDVNRAVGAEMGEPTFKVLSMRQGLWKLILQDVGVYALRKKYIAEHSTEPDPEDPALEVEASFPELTARDTTKWASALQQVAAAMLVSVNAGFITRATAVKMLASIAGRLGVEFDAEAELAAVETEQADAAAKDVFSAPPAKGKGTPPPVPDPASAA